MSAKSITSTDPNQSGSLLPAQSPVQLRKRGRPSNRKLGQFIYGEIFSLLSGNSDIIQCFLGTCNIDANLFGMRFPFFEYKIFLQYYSA